MTESNHGLLRPLARLIAGCMALAMSLPAMAAFSVANPTGVAGTDVDPATGQSVVAEFGNLSLASLNADPDQFTLSFDQSAFVTNQNELDFVSFNDASEVGEDLTDVKTVAGDQPQACDDNTSCAHGVKNPGRMKGTPASGSGRVRSILFRRFPITGFFRGSG